MFLSIEFKVLKLKLDYLNCGTSVETVAKASIEKRNLFEDLPQNVLIFLFVNFKYSNI
jgi:hypothetical protein